MKQKKTDLVKKTAVATLLKEPYLTTPATDSCWQTWHGVGLHCGAEITPYTDLLESWHRRLKRCIQRYWVNDCAMCDCFFQESEPSKHQEKRFGYPYPDPLPVWKQFLDIRIWLETHYPTGKLGSKGVRSLKYLTPTPLLLWLNILRLHSDSETFLSFGLRLLLKLQSECYKLLAVSKRP